MEIDGLRLKFEYVDKGDHGRYILYLHDNTVNKLIVLGVGDDRLEALEQARTILRRLFATLEFEVVVELATKEERVV